MCIFSSYWLKAQSAFGALDKIPICENLRFVKETDSFSVFKPYREEIYNRFSDKSRIGNEFKLWALKSRQIYQYDYLGDIAVESDKCFEFYLKQLNARQSNLFGPAYNGVSDEIDISGIEDGEFSEVVFYSSDFGGGSFEWYYLSDNQLYRFSVTIGLALFLLEEIYEYNPEIEIPNVKDSGFPKYENAFFDALNSVVFPTSEGVSPQMNSIVFYTQDDLNSVVKYYETETGQIAQKSEIEEKWHFSKKRSDLEFYYWPSLTIEEQRFLMRKLPKNLKLK